MMFGALLFAEVYGVFGRTVLKWFDFGAITLPDVLRLPAWLVLLGLSVGTVALFRLIERFELR